MEWVQVISAVGFPIVACIGMGMYFKYNSDRNREDLKEIQKSYKEDLKELQKAHTEESKEMRDALNKMNETLTELVTLWKDK